MQIQELNTSSENANKIINEFPKDFMEDKNRCNELTQKLIIKTKRNTELKYEEFFTKKKTLFNNDRWRETCIFKIW